MESQGFVVNGMDRRRRAWSKEVLALALSLLGSCVDPLLEHLQTML